MNADGNFWQDIVGVVGDEPIVGVVVESPRGGETWWPHERDNETVPANMRNRLLTAEEAKLLLDYTYDTGFGGQDCHDVLVWTPTRVLFVHEYDGSTAIDAKPRNPPPVS